jgi:predicted ATPase
VTDADDDVVLLLTDVEGSTRMMEQDQDLARALLAEHDALVAHRTAAHRGRFVRDRSEGDSAFLVFDDPVAAVRCALDLQRDLRDRAASGPPLRVRMGLHAGRPHRRGQQLYGPVVNRCGAVRNLGHGGQVLLSSAVARLIDGTAGVQLRDLGEHRLKGLNDRERISQAIADDLPSAFPPLRSPDLQRHNLPVAPPGFVEVDGAVDSVVADARASRLLTLVGPAGIGKTALAVQAAWRAIDRFADGVWFVDLAGAGDAASLADALAAAVGVREEPGRPLLDTVVGHVTSRELLLVLDGCDPASTDLATLVSNVTRGAAVHVLAAASRPLGLRGERARPVRPLPVPAADDAAERIAAAPAVRLFLQRVRAASSAAAADPAFLQPVGELCRRLDGLPLALELAAGRLTGTPDDDLVAALDGQLADLDRGRTAGPAVPADALVAALDAAHADLHAEERALLRRAAVFDGGFTLEAAEQVCADDELAEEAVLDALAGLVERSLLVVDDHLGDIRYRSLQSVRSFGATRLAAAGEQPVLADRHRRFFFDLVGAVAPTLAQGPSGLDALEADLDNIRRALVPAPGAFRDGELWVAAQMALFWEVRGHWTAGRHVLESLLDGPTALHHPRALACAGTARIAILQGDYDAADERFGQAAEEWMLLRDGLTADAAGHGADVDSLAARLRVVRSGMQELTIERAELARLRGDLELASSLGHDALRRAQELDDEQRILAALWMLGLIEYGLGHLDAAAELLGESVERTRARGDGVATSRLLNNLGAVHWLRGDFDRARSLYTESLAIRRSLGDRVGIAQSTLNLADVDLAQGRDGRAACAESLAISRDLGHPVGIAEALRLQGELALAFGDVETARASLDEAERLVAALGDPVGLAAVRVRRARVERRAGGAVEDAAEALEASLADVEAAGDTATALTCRAELAVLAAARGDDASARRWLLRAATAPTGIAAIDVDLLDAAAAVLGGAPDGVGTLAGRTAAAWRRAHGVASDGPPPPGPEAPTLAEAVATVVDALEA